MEYDAAALRIARLASVLVWVQAAALICFALLDLAHVTPQRLALGVVGSVLLAAYGLVLAIAGRQFLRWYEWTRGLIVFTQLVVLGLAWNARDTDPRWLAPVLAVMAIAVTVCVLSKPVTRAFSQPKAM